MAPRVRCRNCGDVQDWGVLDEQACENCGSAELEEIDVEE